MGGGREGGGAKNLMDNPTDIHKEIFELGLDGELLELAVLDGEWLDAAEKLPIYKESVALMNDIVTLTRQFPKTDRSMGEQLRMLALHLLSLIYIANHTRETSSLHMRKALQVLIYLRMLCRVCVYQRMLSKKHYAAIAPHFDKIGRQLSGWVTATERKLNNKQ